MTRLRVAVAGMGIGQAHLLAYVLLPELFEVVAIVEPDDDRRTRAAADWGVPHAVADLGDLTPRSVDVIDLCTPPWLHEEHVTAALATGAHVVCEKPLVPSLAALDRLHDVAAAAPGRLMPIFQYRWGAGARRLHALRAAGIGGSLRLVTAETAWWRDASYYDIPWRGRWATEGGGVVHSHAVHIHDLVLWLGGPARRISARTATIVNPVETEDTATALIELARPDGEPAFATASATLGSVREISRLRFAFDGMSVESTTSPYDPGAGPWSFDFADPAVEAAAERCWADLPDEPEGYAGQLAAFHAAITGDLPLPVTLDDARAALELTAAWYLAARSGETVDLPLLADAPTYRSLAP